MWPKRNRFWLFMINIHGSAKSTLDGVSYSKVMSWNVFLLS